MMCRMRGLAEAPHARTTDLVKTAPSGDGGLPDLSGRDLYIFVSCSALSTLVAVNPRCANFAGSSHRRMAYLRSPKIIARQLL